MSIKTVDNTFTRKCYNYTQEQRTEDVCLYSYKFSGSELVGGYEVVRLYTDANGNEYLPGSSLWGIKGWTFLASQLDDAKAKFEKVVKETLKKLSKKTM